MKGEFSIKASFPITVTAVFLTLLLLSCQNAPTRAVSLPTESVAFVTAVPTTILVAANTLTAPQFPTAVPTITPTPLPTAVVPTFSNPRNENLAKEAATAEFVVLDGNNTGIWQYATNSFVHPIAFEIQEDQAYLLDGGRVLQFDMATPAPPELLLSPGDEVAGVRVIEPLDLALINQSLLVLDRAGDVYRYDLTHKTWAVDRYARTIGETSSHYFVAVAGWGNGRYLLETEYAFTLGYEPGQQEQIWPLPAGHMVDVAVNGQGQYVLMVPGQGMTATLTLYQNAEPVETFQPGIFITQPRQVIATETAVYVLDHAGKRLLALHPQTGALLQLYQLPAQEFISTFAVSGGQLFLAGKERFYFYNQPERLTAVPGGPTLTGLQPHDPIFLASLTGFVVPITGSDITRRDLQMPGAPRHYRLGVHEGIDLYWGRGTAVLAAADGVIIRALLEYQLPTERQFDHWYDEAHELGFTSAEGLDFYRGRQVWIQHENGLVSRYAHLSGIRYTIQPDGFVVQGEKIGEVGNTGSPASKESETEDAHLHFELWLGEHYVGQFLRPIETRELFEKILLKEG